MFTKSVASIVVVASVAGLAVSGASAQITIPTVTIGNPGNAADPTTGYGSVAYTYNIGATEVTNAQYAAFLNAVARTDRFDLYNVDWAGPFGGITRTGEPGTYSYATVASRANNPVHYVNFWNATRFANWLHNGQPATGVQDSSTTEDGAYTLTEDGRANNTVTRNAGAQWAVPSEDEWYKAAYHQPASAGGDSDNYWLYPNSSNTITTAQANYLPWLAGQGPGDVIGNSTPVGSYAANYYGAFDMGGNVMEWNEAILNVSSRGLRGGNFSWQSDVNNLRADFRLIDFVPGSQNYTIGFRVSQVPAPGAVALLAIGGLVAGQRRRCVCEQDDITADRAVAGRAVRRGRLQTGADDSVI
ncbi:MAG: formylglycine-generating enzyme family protein, partial [bacterium]